MNPIPQPLKKLEIDPVARSIAKPDAFSKPASFNQAKSKNTVTRIRTMNWKRGKGRPRKTVRDPRDVQFF